MLSGRKPTEEEQQYMDDVAQGGCIICRLYLGFKEDTITPAEIHHIDGKTKPGCHKKILGLCDKHHRIPGKGYVSRADGKKAFEAAYMPEEDLMVVQQELVKKLRERTIGRRT